MLMLQLHPLLGQLTALIVSLEIALRKQNGSTTVSVYGRKSFMKSANGCVLNFFAKSSTRTCRNWPAKKLYLSPVIVSVVSSRTPVPVFDKKVSSLYILTKILIINQTLQLFTKNVLINVQSIDQCKPVSCAFAHQFSVKSQCV